MRPPFRCNRPFGDLAVLSQGELDLLGLGFRPEESFQVVQSYDSGDPGLQGEGSGLEGRTGQEKAAVAANTS